MSTTAALIELLPTRLAEFANRAEERRRALGLTQEEVAERCNQARGALSLGDRPWAPRVSRERVAKILMARHGPRAVQCARALYPYEVHLFAAALEASPEWLLGPDPAAPVVLWDLRQSNRSRHVVQIVESALADTVETLSWGESVPFLLAPERFAREHHIGLYRGIYSADSLATLLQGLDAIGTALRPRLAKRTAVWEHAMASKDLRALVCGNGSHPRVSAAAVANCLETLAAQMDAERLTLRLMDAEAPPPALRDIDFLWVMGNRLAIWRDHCGGMQWSEHRATVNERRLWIATARLGARALTGSELRSLQTRLRDR